MEQGWDASRQLRNLLEQRRKQGLPHTHHWLASATGIGQGTISAYATRNDKSRRTLGRRNAEKIAAALGVTPQDLGSPEATAADSSSTAAHLQELGEQVEELMQNQAKILRSLQTVRRRLVLLEARGERGEDAPRGQGQA